MGISTHVLDTSRGRPAEGILVRLSVVEGGKETQLASGTTDADGRIKPLLEKIPAAAAHRITFEVGGYFEKLGVEAFFPRVTIDFVVRAAHEHYHVPLLLNPFGFSTYRGS